MPDQQQEELWNRNGRPCTDDINNNLFSDWKSGERMIPVINTERLPLFVNTADADSKDHCDASVLIENNGGVFGNGEERTDTGRIQWKRGCSGFF